MTGFIVGLQKTIPTTSTLGANAFSNGGSSRAIEIIGVTELRWETNKTLIPIPFLQVNYDGTDGSNTNMIDLKNLSDKLTVTGWLEDDSQDTAWEKAWMLRAMEVVGGPLAYLVIGPTGHQITFQQSTICAYLERVSWTYKPHDVEITSQTGIGKIEVTLVFTIAKNKMF